MIRRPPRSTQAHTLFPYTRSSDLLTTESISRAECTSAAVTSEMPSRWTSERSEEHTSELQSRELRSYAVFCTKKKEGGGGVVGDGFGGGRGGRGAGAAGG